MTVKVGINGFGRMGRLVLRTAWDWPELEFVRVNDPAGDAATFAHLLEFDSVHGRWSRQISSESDALLIDGRRIDFSRVQSIKDGPWADCDIVIEASGVMRRMTLLEQYLDLGVGRVVVTAPVKEPGALNIVMGINDQLFEPDRHAIVTAASCTTNCLAPVVQVIHEQFEIRHGSITTIHDITNTQSILDQAHKDLRRSRASSMSLIPTSTGSATAIAEIFPELRGRLDGHAVRVPLANASLTDCVFEVASPTTAEAVNAALADAAQGRLAGILGVESRPLVSIDYRGDPRSAIVDAPSTLVVSGTQIKIYAWYDNEWGYANRTAELVRLVAHTPAN